MAMVIRYKKLNELAVPPFKTHAEDFCYDVVAVSEEEIAPNPVAFVHEMQQALRLAGLHGQANGFIIR